MTDSTKPEVTLDLKRWGVIVALLVGLWGLTTAAQSILDDRYVKHADFQQLRSDVRVIRTAICQDRPMACQQ
jgi:hypothetical protein